MPGSLRHRRAPVAASLASVLTLSTFGALTFTAAPAQAAETPITTGSGLDWGVKASWRNYIGPGGTTLSDGATRNEDGTFHLPVAGGRYDDVTRTTVVDFDGTIEFLSHCHGEGGNNVRPCDLDLTMTDFRVEITEDHASIFVDAQSRPIAGGDIVTYDDVPLVDLDVEDAAPVVTGGSTRWSDLTATMTLEGERVFNYAAGTVVDPVTFGYQGPGGKPVGETWDVAGQTVHEAIAADPQPASTAHRIVGRLSTGELVGWNDSLAVAVLDPETLAPLSAWTKGPGVTGDILRDSIAVDPATNTIFAATATTNTNDRRLATFTWDGTDLTMTEVPASHAPDLNYDSGSAGTWDAANDRYLVARTRSANATDMWQVTEVGGVWTASKIGPLSISQPGTSTWENAIVNLVAVPDGAGRSAILATSLFGVRPLQRLAQVGNTFVGEPLAETGDLQPERIFGTRNGVYAVSAGANAVFLPYVGYADNRRLGAATEPVQLYVDTDTNRTRSTITADWASDTLVAITDSGQNLTRLEQGRLAARGGLDTGAYGNNIVVGLNQDGDIWGIREGQLVTVRPVAQSPAFTQQPEAPTADLTTADATSEVTVTAVVSGTPAPALTWQTRTPGQAWAEVTDGVDGDTLTDTVSTADQGRQYRLIAENTGGRVASDRVTLTLRTLPRIMVQPADVAAAPGESVELKVMPDGAPAPTIQWQQRIGGVWHDVPGETGATLRLDDVDSNLSGTAFRARLTNPVGSVISERATVTVAEPNVERREITDGTVDWGVKASFRNYINGPIAHGTVTVAGGVTANDDGTYAFPVVDGEWDPAGSSTIELGGSVRFTGHDSGSGPQLDLTITDPRVVIDPEGSTLVADVVSRGLSSGSLATFDDVVLADLQTGDRVRALGDALTLTEVPAALTAEGVPAFADFYPEGSALDPISGTVELGGVVGEPGTDPEPVTTRTTVLVAGATPFGQAARLRVAVSSDDGKPANGSVKLTAAGRTWTARVLNGVASSATPAGVVPGSYVLRAQFTGEGLEPSSDSDTLRVTKATPSVKAKLPKKQVRANKRAKLAVTATLPGSNLRATGKVVVRDGGKVVLRANLKPNAKGKTVLRLPRLARGSHRITVKVVANPRLRATTSKAVVLRVR